MDHAVAQLPLVDAFDGGVSRRLVRRCRTAATIALVIGTALLLVVAVAPWGVIPALMTLTAGTAISGSVLLLRRGAMWSAVGGSLLPGVTSGSTDAGGPPRIGTQPTPVFGAPATIGRPRPMSPGVAGAPVRRRLSSAVVPIHTEDGPSPGGGGLVVHARADGTALVEGDKVLVWLAGHEGLMSLPTGAEGERSASSVRGRFVFYRQPDNAVFLATTRLTDTW